MKKAWANRKTKEKIQQIEETKNSIRNGVRSMPYDFSDEQIESFVDKAVEIFKIGLSDVHFCLPPFLKTRLYEERVNILRHMEKMTGTYDRLNFLLHENYYRYVDSEPVRFRGNIIISDPCYIIRDVEIPEGSHIEDDWEKSNYGESLDNLGINTFITRDTIYGDWSCTVFDISGEDKKEYSPMGEFCADSGQVSVMLLDEVLKYNPLFDYYKSRPWTTTLIENFDGECWFEVVRKSDDYNVHVCGKGINTETGEPVVFKSIQTGL